MPVGAGRTAKVTLQTSAAGMDQGLNDARRKLKTFGRETEKATKRARKPSGPFAFGMVASAGAKLTDVLVDQAKEVMNLEKSFAYMQIGGKLNAQQMGGFRDELTKASTATGVSRGQLLEAARAFTAITGEASVATANLTTFGMVANATGADMTSIVAAGAAMSQALSIKPEDFQKGYDVIIQAGKDGAIEMSNLREILAEVAPGFSQFAGSKSVTGLAELNAALQVMKQGFGTADESATAFKGTMTQLQRYHKGLEKVGVKIADPKTGKLRNFLSIIKDIGNNEKLMKPFALLDVLKEQKAVTAVQTLIRNMEMVDRLKKESLGSDATAKDNAQFLASTYGSMELAMNKLKLAVVAAFTPERIRGFADAVSAAASKMEPLIASLGKVGGALGWFYKIGQKVRGALPGGNGHEFYRQEDTNRQWAREWSPQRDAARANIAGVDAGNAAIDRIVAAEVDEKSTPESIARAMDYKWTGKTSNERVQGASYLNAAKFVDPLAVAEKETRKLIEVINSAKFAQTIAEAIKRAQFVIRIGPEPIQKGAASAPVRQPGGH